MDRNSIIGLILIFVILVVYFFINQDTLEQLEKREALEKDSIETVKAQDSLKKAQESVLSAIDSSDAAIVNDSVAAVVDSSLKTQKYGAFANHVDADTQLTTLENDLIAVTFSSKGGRVYSVDLKNYQRYDSTNLVLFEGAKNRFDYSFYTADNKTISTADLDFTDVEKREVENGTLISMKVKLSEGKYLEQVYTLKKGSYVVDYQFNIVGLGDFVSPQNRYMELNWNSVIPRQEKTKEAETEASTIFYRFKGDEVDNISERSFEEAVLATSVEWVCYKQRFFNTTLIYQEGFESGKVTTVESPEDKTVMEMKSMFNIPLSGNANESLKMAFYFGPNKYTILNKMDNGMEEIIPLGWAIFRWVNTGVIIPVFNFLSGLNLGYGLIILILTLLIKLVLSPITYRMYKSSAKMRVLKPEIEEINKKFAKADAVKKQQATMALYKQAGVNPLAGCIPALLQMPILIAVFRFFPASIELRQKGFLWAEDLSTYDSVASLPFNIPFYGDHVSLFTILMAISVFFYSKYNTGATGGSDMQAKQMKVFMYLMPFMLLIWFNSYSAGLSYYYLLSNIISIAMTLAIRKWVINEDAIHAQIQENKKKGGGKKSKFQQRLEDMAKQRGMDPKNLKR